MKVGTMLQHRHFGRGRVIASYEDANVGDMVEVHWLDTNEVLDHREENLRFGLQTMQEPDTSQVSPWLSLLEET